MEIKSPLEPQRFGPDIQLISDIPATEVALSGQGRVDYENESGSARSLALRIGGLLALPSALFASAEIITSTVAADGWIPPNATGCATPGVPVDIIASPPCYAWTIGTTETTPPTQPGGTTHTTQPGGTTHTTQPGGTTHTTQPGGTTHTTQPKQPAYNWNTVFNTNCSAQGNGEPGWLSIVGADPAMRIGQIIQFCPDNVMLNMIEDPSANVTHTQQQVDTLAQLIWNKYAPTTTTAVETTTAETTTVVPTTVVSTTTEATSTSSVSTSSSTSVKITPSTEATTISQESTTTTQAAIVAVKPPTDSGSGFHLTGNEVLAGGLGVGSGLGMALLLAIFRHRHHSAQPAH